MSLALVLKIYFCINCLIIVGYFLFQSLRTVANLARLNISYRQWIQTAQIILISSLVAPLIMQWIPAQNSLVREWGPFQTMLDAQWGRDSSLVKKSELNTNVFLLKTNKQPTAGTVFYKTVQNWVEKQIPAHRIDWIAWILIFGFSILAIRFGMNFRNLLRLAKSSIVIRRFGKVCIGLSDEVSIPISVLLGFQKWIFIPTDLLTTSRDFRIAIRHEMQHHRQGDTKWAIFIELLVCLFFPNPAIYKWKRDIVELQEYSCDEALIGQRRISSYEYGRCLIRVAEAALGNCQMPIGTIGMATISKNPKYYKSFLRRRIEMFTSHERPRFAGKAGALIGTIAFLVTVSTAFGVGQVLKEKSQMGPNPGDLSVDQDIQSITERVLKDAILMQNAKGGFAIVADPMTGKILAAVDIDSTDTLPENWALNQQLEPASLIKTLVAAQAIESGLTAPQAVHACENGYYRFGNRVYHDWKKKGWEHLTTEETVTNSSDICSMKIAEKIGAEGLRQMLVDFGFGPGGSVKSFPKARVGTLPPADDRNNPKMVPFVSAGFGFKTTPLELVQAYGAIANGGLLLMPQTADTENAHSEVIRRVLSADTANKVKEILRQVVLKGTGKRGAQSHLYSTAGKTASSYVPDLTKWDLVEGRKRGNFAGFIGFAPVNEPRVEVYVGIHDPSSRDGAHGGTHAAPVFRRIVEDVLVHMNVAPDKK